MNTRFTDAQLVYIRDQASIYLCACPAQVAAAVSTMRGLQLLQAKCIEGTDLDRDVHDRIAEAALKCHAELEHCLEDILKLEGWNMDTLEMPASLKKQFLERI